jgi:hypothetical protein
MFSAVSGNDGMSHRIRTVAAIAPHICAAMKNGASMGRDVGSNREGHAVGSNSRTAPDHCEQPECGDKLTEHLSAATSRVARQAVW